MSRGSAVCVKGSAVYVWCMCVCVCVVCVVCGVWCVCGVCLMSIHYTPGKQCMWCSKVAGLSATLNQLDRLVCIVCAMHKWCVCYLCTCVCVLGLGRLG